MGEKIEYETADQIRRMLTEDERFTDVSGATAFRRADPTRGWQDAGYFSLERNGKRYFVSVEPVGAPVPAPEVRAAAGQEARELGANDWALLFRLIDRYTEDCRKESPDDHQSHAYRQGVRERVTKRLIAAREAERNALAAVERDREPGTISKRCGVPGCTLPGLH